MYQLTEEQFEDAIENAIDAIPSQFIDALDNVAIIAEDEPTAAQLGVAHNPEKPGGTFGTVPAGIAASQGSQGAIGTFSNSPECASSECAIGHEELLGLYSGINITERGEYYEMAEPDIITIFKGPHERICNSYEQITTQIAKTVIHEIGHYFGLDDERLHEIGY